MSQQLLMVLYCFFKVHGEGTEGDFLQHIFSTYFFSREINDFSSLASRILTGERLPPRTIAFFYADPDAPHCPRCLYTDANFFMQVVCTAESERNALYARLQAYAEGLPQLDNAEILREHTAACTGERLSVKAADMLTRLLWHALCWDAAVR